MRPHGKTKLGFFPLPAQEADRLRSCLTGDSEFSALDACVGDGAAFNGARRFREWFSVSGLAQVLGISRSEVQKWIDQGRLPCRTVQVHGVNRKIIDPEDFCLFVKNHGRAVIGNRLSYEGLTFVRDYVFPRAHADLLSVRGPYEKGKKPAEADETALADRDECDGNVTNA